VDDARFAIDACAFDDIVVELIALLLGDEGSNMQGNTSISYYRAKSSLFPTFLDRNVIYRVIHKLMGAERVTALL